IFGRSGKALLPVVGKRDLLETDRSDHSPDEAVTFGHLRDDIGDPSRHQPEIPGIDRNQHIRRSLENSVEQPCCEPLEPRYYFASLPETL
ncbi:MAG: hypothetical protein ACXWWA_09740, partial [Chitinophagaceae bacterium]